MKHLKLLSTVSFSEHEHKPVPGFPRTFSSTLFAKSCPRRFNMFSFGRTLLQCGCRSFSVAVAERFAGQGMQELPLCQETKEQCCHLSTVFQLLPS